MPTCASLSDLLNRVLGHLRRVPAMNDRGELRGPTREPRRARRVGHRRRWSRRAALFRQRALLAARPRHLERRASRDQASRRNLHRHLRPWGVHETRSGRVDFGEKDARLDVVAFLRLVAELGLLAIVRPGPHVNAELTHFGIPERIIWDAACQAQIAARQRRDAPHGSGRISGAELRQRRISRRGREVARPRWPRCLRRCAFPRDRSCFARSTTRARSTFATGSTIRTTGPKRLRSIAHFCGRNTAPKPSSRAPTGGAPIRSTASCPPPSSTPIPPTSSPSTSTGPSFKSASWPDRWRA